MLTPEQLNDYLEPFLAPGADPKAPDLDHCDVSCLVGFLFETVINYEAAAVATLHGDDRGIELARRTFFATQDATLEMGARIRGQWTITAIEEFLRGQAE